MSKIELPVSIIFKAYQIACKDENIDKKILNKLKGLVFSSYLEVNYTDEDILKYMHKNDLIVYYSKNELYELYGKASFRGLTSQINKIHEVINLLENKEYGHAFVLINTKKFKESILDLENFKIKKNKEVEYTNKPKGYPRAS